MKMDTDIIYYNTSTESGCSSLATGAIWLIALSAALMFISGLVLLCNYDLFYINTYVGSSLCWIGLYFVSLFILIQYFYTTQSYLDFLNVWAIENRPVPVFVGEIFLSFPSDNDFTRKHGTPSPRLRRKGACTCR